MSTVQELPDGRVTVDRADPRLQASPYCNADLAPTTIGERHWNTYNYAALWVGMSHCIPSYLLASGLILAGMSWVQAVITIAIANLIVLVPMLLNGHAGTKYGIPFPVFARSSLGVRGANIAAVMRALVACCWFGIQTWIGGEGFFILLSKLVGGNWAKAHVVYGYPWTQWVCFAGFWIVEMLIIWRGMETLRRFENWAAPFVIAGAVALFVYLVVKAGGLGPIVHEGSNIGWGSKFWHLFFPSLMGMIGFWSTLSLNIPDFTRFGASQRKQMWGQALGLPTTMTAFALLAVLITSGAEVVYHQKIWDPIALTGRLNNDAALAVALAMIAVATISVNVAANTVSPSYDFSNLAPRLISFRTGGLITGFLGLVMCPWYWLSTFGNYVFGWLVGYSGLLGPVAGIMVTDYFLVRHTRLDTYSLYRRGGMYEYRNGFNPVAILALICGVVTALVGRFVHPLAFLYDYAWFVGFFLPALSTIC